VRMGATNLYPAQAEPAGIAWATKKSRKTSNMLAMSFMRMLSAGPEVSLSGVDRPPPPCAPPRAWVRPGGHSSVGLLKRHQLRFRLFVYVAHRSLLGHRLELARAALRHLGALVRSRPRHRPRHGLHQRGLRPRGWQKGAQVLAPAGLACSWHAAPEALAAPGELSLSKVGRSAAEARLFFGRDRSRAFCTGLSMLLFCLETSTRTRRDATCQPASASDGHCRTASVKRGTVRTRGVL
jgi:hypothetical protein